MVESTGKGEVPRIELPATSSNQNSEDWLTFLETIRLQAMTQPDPEESFLTACNDFCG